MGSKPVTGANAESYRFTEAEGQQPDYVGIYIGDNNMVHAMNPEKGILVSNVNAPTGGPMMDTRRVIRQESTVSEDPWRPYPWPTMVRMIVDKPVEGKGFDRVPLRRDRIRGFCTHITDGTGEIEDIYALFSRGGERQYDALTDLVLGRDGRIGLLNDWRDPNWGGTRAGWANGGVDGLEGEGLAYYRNVGDINSTLVSCEHIAREGEAWTAAQIQQTIELRVALAQERRIPWDHYPIDPTTGASFEQQHRNFATKSCPANPYISQYDAQVRAEVKARLKAWQGGEPTPPEPKLESEAHFTVHGFTREHIDYLFGTMQRVNANGTVDELSFDPQGPLSLLWLDRCEREGVFPEAEQMRTFDATLAEGREWFATWEGGWLAWLPVDNGRAGWRWIQGKDAIAAIPRSMGV